MLQNYTIVPLSHDQAVTLLAETTAPGRTLDLMSANSTICTHPEFGDLIVFENAAGLSAVALHNSKQPKLSNRLFPSNPR